MAQAPVLSVIAPIFNEAGNIAELYRRIKDVMDGLGDQWEMILVNDGSRDESQQIMEGIYDQDKANVRVIRFARNFGHQMAVTAVMDYAKGDAIVLIDADLQDPPELIPQLMSKWREGYEVVYAIRAKREGEGWFKLATASL